MGLRVPQAVLGTMTFGDTVDEDGARRILTAALDAGVTWVDTANVYAGGESERLLGRLLPRDRSDLTIATKVGIAHPDAGDRPLLSPAAIRACVTASLQRLRAERVDLLYLHQPDPATPPEETFAEVQALIADGLVGHVATSNFAAWQLALISREPWPQPVVAQQVYSPVARRLEDEYAGYAAAHDVATLAYNPLAGGLLAGRHRPGDEAVGGRFGSSRLSTTYRDRYWNEAVFGAVEQLGSVAAAHGLSLVELSLRWTLSAPFISGVLVGGSSAGQIEENLAALARGPLPADVVAEVSAVTDPLRGAMPAYNR